MTVVLNGSRADRRARGLRGQARPTADLFLSRVPGTPYVLVGLRAAGFVRLPLAAARDLADEILELVNESPEPQEGPQ